MVHQQNTHHQSNIQDKDFSRRNLKGRNFSGKNLQGANFFEADLQNADFSRAKLQGANFLRANIQGTNFTKAILTSANFTEVRTGLNPWWCFFISVFSLGLCLLSAFPAAVSTTFLVYFFLASHRKLNLLTLAMLVGSWSVVLTMFIRTLLIEYPNPITPAIHVTIGIGAIFMVLLGEVIAIVITDSKRDFSGLFWSTVVFLVILALTLYTSHSSPSEVPENWLANFLKYILSTVDARNYSIWTSSLFGAIIGAFFGCWFAQSALLGQRFSWLWKMYVQATTYGGTSFKKADLTNAVFSSAILKGANLVNARITGTRWNEVEGLDCACVGNSYLKHPKILRLLTEEGAEDKEFDGLKLEGINLDGTDLSGASFIATNLNQASLRGTDLTEADLKQASLDGADLTEATLTGAWLENCHISKKTILDGVVCEYIYLEKPPGRRPNWRRFPTEPEKFEPGDFEQYWRRDDETIKLLIRNDYNREALGAAFTQLVQENPDITPDAFQGARRLGDDLLVTIQVPQQVNKRMAEEQFERVYRQVQQESPTGVGLGKQDTLAVLELVLSLFKEVKEIMSNPPGNRTTNINVSNSPDSNIAGEVGRDQNLTHHSYSLEQKKTLAEAAAEIQELLKQLEHTNPSATEDERMAYVNEKVASTLKQRVVGALEAGGEAAIDEFLINNPYAKIVKAIVKAWMKPE